MSEFEHSRSEIAVLRGQLSGLTEAMLRVSGDLDLDKVLQEVLHSARALTGARYAAITTIDDTGNVRDVLFSGLTPDEERSVLGFDSGIELYQYLSSLREPLRTSDFVAHAESAGFSGFRPQIGAFLSAQITASEGQVGTLYFGEKHDDSDFTAEDEEIVEMFARQAAMAVTNARRYGDEQRAKADLEALVNTSPIGVMVVDVASESVVKLNTEARRLLGLESDLDNLSVASFERLMLKRMDGSEVAIRDLPFVQELRNGETVRAEELVIVRTDGSEVATLVNATPIRSEDGELATVIATLQDMSPLEQLERLRTEFLAMVSHELRGPLTSIKGSAATMRSLLIPPDPVEVGQFFRMVEEQADHMRDLVNDLLDMSRIEAGTLSVSPVPVDLETVVEQARNAFISGGHRQRIELDLSPGLPRVWVDRQRVVQVLHNLLSNAAANSQEWSTIRLSASLDNAHVAVSVADEGAGIAPEELPLLFTKFSSGIRAGSERSDAGHGLGLAISKGIVEAHGGRIWAHSAGHGSGAEFTFTVPVLDESAHEAAVLTPGDGDEDQVATRIERILVVDDDPQALRFIRSTLAGAGYGTIAASDPAGIERLLDAEKPHLVLLDVVMPRIDGFELIERMPRILEVPVIMVSGRGDDQFVARAFGLGAADYIVKPFSPTELLVRVAAALRRQSQSRHTEPYRCAGLTVDYLTRAVTVSGREVHLTPTEYKLLSRLCMNAGVPLSYEQLIETVWGEDSPADAQRVRTFVKELRAKLGDNARKPTYILTVPGVGYRAAAP